MPNWFYFELTAVGEEKDVQDFVQNVKGTEKYETLGREFDFNHFIPQPDNIYRGSISFDDEQRLEKDGIPNWYQWNNHHWGTKWNANNEDDVQVYMNGSMSFATYRLATAWALPSPVICAMIDKYPNLNFLIEGEEESGEYGVYIDSSKDVWLKEEPIEVDPNNYREIYYKKQDDLMHYPYYKDDDTLVPDPEDFYPIYKFSWS